MPPRSAEYAIAMAMILLRGRAYLDTHRLVAGEWPREELGRGVELAGKTLGIIGLGSIGSTTRAQGARAGDARRRLRSLSARRQRELERRRRR